jgi:hypothetical protein
MLAFRSFLAFLILLLALGCAQPQPSTPTAVSQTTPTATVLPTNTAVPPTTTFTPTPLATHTATPVPTPIMTPTLENPNIWATAAYIVVAGWSLDSQWLAYWLSTKTDVENMQPYTSPIGSLFVTNSITGERCSLPHFRFSDPDRFILNWEPDNNLILHERETNRQWRVRPCQPGTFALPDQPRPVRITDEGLSPDGRFHITTTTTTELQNEEDNILTFSTVLGHQNGAEITAVTWQTNDAKGEWGLGGEWVSPTQFLTLRSLDGPLLLDATRPGQVINVQLDLFHYEVVREDVTISAAPGPEPDSYRLLLNDWGGQENVQLFHADIGVVETLPYYEPWWPPFTANSEWLLMKGEGTYNLWARPAADIDSEWRLVAEGAANTLWNADGSQMAFGSRQTQEIIWQTFPDGELIGQWSTTPFQVRPTGWSPYGWFLAAVGQVPGHWEYALFIFDRPR